MTVNLAVRTFTNRKLKIYAHEFNKKEDVDDRWIICFLSISNYT